MKKSLIVGSVGAVVAIVTALAAPACSSSKKDSSPPSTINDECRIGAATALTLKMPDGSTTDIKPYYCYIQGPTASGGQFFAFKYTAKSGDMMLLVDVQPGADGTPYTSQDVGNDQPPTAGFAPATPAGTVKVWISTAASTAAPWDWWTTTAGATINVKNKGGWPTNSATGAAEAAIEFVSAPMKVRPCADYAPEGGAYCGPKGSTADAGPKPDAGGTPDAGGPTTTPGFLSGTILVRFGATPDECDPSSGGAACTTIASCNDDKQCTCENATCNLDLASDSGVGKCCIQNGLPCGTAGGGADCCSGLCGKSGTCVEKEFKKDKCGSPGGGPGTLSPTCTKLLAGRSYTCPDKAPDTSDISPSTTSCISDGYVAYAVALCFYQACGTDATKQAEAADCAEQQLCNMVDLCSSDCLTNPSSCHDDVCHFWKSGVDCDYKPAKCGIKNEMCP